MVNHKTNVFPKRSHRYTNEELIQNFVKGLTQNNPPLLSNRTLRTTSLNNTTQLLVCKTVILTAYYQDPPTRAVVDHSSPYGELLKEAFLAESYYPLTRTEQRHEYIYQYCKPPHGYQLHCTTAKELWRICWGRGGGLRSGISLDLLVWGGGASRSNQNWRSLRQIDCEQGELLFKLIGGRFSVESSELVVWAKNQKTPGKSQGQRARSSLRGVYRLRN